LPGLSIAQDVTHLHVVVQQIRSLDEARKKKQQLKEKESDETLPTESAGPNSAHSVDSSGQ